MLRGKNWAVDGPWDLLPARTISVHSIIHRGLRPLFAILPLLGVGIFFHLVPLEKSVYFSHFNHYPGILADEIRTAPPHPEFKIDRFALLTNDFIDIFVEEIMTPHTEVGAWILQSPNGSIFLRKIPNAVSLAHHSLLRRVQLREPQAEEILMRKIQEKAKQTGRKTAYLFLENILWYGKFREPIFWNDFRLLYRRLVMDTEITFPSFSPSGSNRIVGTVHVHRKGTSLSPADMQSNFRNFVIAGNPQNGDLHLFCLQKGQRFYVGKIGQFPQIGQLHAKYVGCPPEFSVHSYIRKQRIHLRGDRPRYWFFDGTNWMHRELKGNEGYVDDGFSLSNARHMLIAIDQRENIAILERVGNQIACFGIS